MKTDEPTIEDRLRHTLRTVADATEVPEPRDADEVTYLTNTAADPSPARGQFLAWRLIGAAAVVLMLIAGVAVFSHGRADVVQQPAVPGTSVTSTSSPTPPGSSTPGPIAAPTVEELDANGVPIRPSAQLKDQWAAAYGIYICDHFVDSLKDRGEDTYGIHTHQDGVIHIHPFGAASSGRHATLGLFADDVGVQIFANGIRLPDGATWPAGMQCNGTTQTTFAVFRWKVDDPSALPEVFTSDFKNIRLDADRMAYTIAVVPVGVTPPKPPSIPTLDQLTDIIPPCNGAGCPPTVPTITTPH